MTWTLAVVDDGITNALQRSVGKPTAVEYDLWDGPPLQLTGATLGGQPEARS